MKGEFAAIIKVAPECDERAICPDMSAANDQAESQQRQCSVRKLAGSLTSLVVVVMLALSVGSATLIADEEASGSRVPFPMPKDGGSEAFRNYETLFETTQFPNPMRSSFAGGEEWQGYFDRLNRFLFSRVRKVRWDFDIRYMEFGGPMPELLYCIQARPEETFVEVLLVPKTRGIGWRDYQDPLGGDEAIEIELVERPIDPPLAYQLIGLWNDLLKRVSYREDTYRKRIVIEDGAMFYFSSNHPTLGLIEGEVSNPRHDTIVGRAARIAGEMARGVRGANRASSAEISDRIRKLRDEIRFTDDK